jgi:hypothetical protein
MILVALIDEYNEKFSINECPLLPFLISLFKKVLFLPSDRKKVPKSEF